MRFLLLVFPLLCFSQLHHQTLSASGGSSQGFSESSWFYLLDSLLSLFEEVRIVEANKAFSNGTNLYMSESTEDNAEIALLNRKITLSEQIEKIRLDKLKARNVVDVVAAFPKVGYLEESFWKNMKTQGIAAGLLLLSLFYLTIHLDAFLKSKS